MLFAKSKITIRYFGIQLTIRMCGAGRVYLEGQTKTWPISALYLFLRSQPFSAKTFPSLLFVYFSGLFIQFFSTNSSTAFKGQLCGVCDLFVSWGPQPVQLSNLPIVSPPTFNLRQKPTGRQKNCFNFKSLLVLGQGFQNVFQQLTVTCTIYN